MSTTMTRGALLKRAGLALAGALAVHATPAATLLEGETVSLEGLGGVSAATYAATTSAGVDVAAQGAVVTGVAVAPLALSARSVARQSLVDVRGHIKPGEALQVATPGPRAIAHDPTAAVPDQCDMTGEPGLMRTGLQLGQERSLVAAAPAANGG